MRWFARLYGSSPLHLLVTIACFALAGYAANKLRAGDYAGILVWLGGAVIGHDLVLFPLYAIADRSVMAVFRRRPPSLPAVPWINYLRVPVVFSAILLMIWFPLIFRLPADFSDKTDLSLSPYLGRWLAVTGTLFLLSAAALALRLRPRRGTQKNREPEWREPARRTAGLPPGRNPRSSRAAGGRHVMGQARLDHFDH